MLAYLIGMIIGEHEENKKIEKIENNYYQNLDIKNVENVLFTARLTQYGKSKYYTEDDKYLHLDKYAKLDEKTKNILRKLVFRGDIQKHELDHLIDKILENQLDSLQNNPH